MKKFLLLSVVALGASMAYAQEDVTPAGYHYYNYDGEFSYGPEAYLGANLNNVNPVWAGVNGDAYYHDGLVIAGGGQYQNSANGYFATLKAGTGIVDLGGEVGKVLAISTPNSSINDYLKAEFGDAAPEVPVAGEGSLNWFNINWFFNPNNCPTKSTASRIRVRITMNVYSKALDATNVMNNIYPVTDQGGVRPQQSNASAKGSAVTLNEFFKWEEGMEGELPYFDDFGNLVWDRDRWLVYEFDADCPDEDEDGTVYSPLRLKVEFNMGNINDCTLFIRDISFLADNEEPVNGERYRSFETLTVDPSTASVDKIQASEVNAAAEYYNLQGVRVANPSNGLYIVKQGNKVSKQFVK